MYGTEDRHGRDRRRGHGQLLGRGEREGGRGEPRLPPPERLLCGVRASHGRRGGGLLAGRVMDGWMDGWMALFKLLLLLLLIPPFPLTAVSDLCRIALVGWFLFRQHTQRERKRESNHIFGLCVWVR